MGTLLHYGGKDCEIDEYVIPKGTDVLFNIRGLMYDQEVKNTLITREILLLFQNGTQC